MTHKIFFETNKARLPGVTQWRKATPNALRTQTALGSRSPPIKPTPIRGKPTSPFACRHDNKLASSHKKHGNIIASIFRAKYEI
ncbi:hypothetical protein QVD17_05340 [Tagetes erecta]|uniref:Uncharacterized protein n=1 Tax=Tagetes erecta TaxID=13708 RepID=A0AAD8LBS9_TARER|nr:hypothetical protein QVD17_05340 [Tagetes erecta]